MLSKYREKHYEEVEFDLFDTTCPHCKTPFMIDYRYLKHVEIDNDEDFVRIRCPYCEKRYYEHE